MPKLVTKKITPLSQTKELKRSITRGKKVDSRSLGSNLGVLSAYDVEVKKQEVIRVCCQNSFLSFCLAIKPDFINTKIHAYLACQLEKMYRDVVAGKDARLTIEIQPQLGKSTLASVLFPAWVLGREGWPVIVASYGASLAERKSQECRDIIESENFKLIFPYVKLHPDSTSKEFWRTTTGGSYRAVGVGGGLTGMSGKLLLCDDPIADRQSADSETVRESTWRWWQTVFYTRKQSKSGICLINTRWHLDDVSGRIHSQEEASRVAQLPVGTYDEWTRLRFSAIAEVDEVLPDLADPTRMIPFRKAGEVLCPERFSYADMVKTRNALDPMEWAALYQQDPILQENAKFKVAWFRYWEAKQVYSIPERFILRTDLDVYVMVDLAISQKATADNTSIQVIAKAPGQPDVFLLEDITNKFDPSEVIETLFKLKLKYGVSLKKIGVETVAYQKALLHFLNKEMVRRDLYFNVVELKASNSTKVQRVEGLIPYYKHGQVWHSKGSSHEIEKELLQFPKGKHDDRVDALAYFPQLVKHAEGRTTSKQFIPKMKRY